MSQYSSLSIHVKLDHKRLYYNQIVFFKKNGNLFPAISLFLVKVLLWFCRLKDSANQMFGRKTFRSGRAGWEW